MSELVAADPLAFAWLAFYSAVILGALGVALMEYKREIDRRIIAERRAAESWRIGTTWRRNYLINRTEPTWLRTSMQQLRRAS